MTNKSISEQLIEAADKVAAKSRNWVLNPSEINHVYLEEAKEAFKRLAQQVEERFEKIAILNRETQQAVMEREQLWLKLDKAWQEYQRSYDSTAFYPLGGKVGQLRKQLGLTDE